MRLIDTHAHLVMAPLDDQVESVLARARQAGVDSWITIGTDLSDSGAGIELTGQFEQLYCTVGVHPHEAARVNKDFSEQLRPLAQADKVCALGETGLDYYYEHSDRASQQEVFQQQLELAHQLSLPVVIHCRDAFDDCLDILKRMPNEPGSFVFHCFSGNRKIAARVLDMGGFLSLTGTITFRNAAELQDAVCYAPLDRLLLETDCPYLSPEPKRKVKPNEPALLVHIADKLAELKNISTAEIAQITTNNARLFFDID